MRSMTTLLAATTCPSESASEDVEENAWRLGCRGLCSTLPADASAADWCVEEAELVLRESVAEGVCAADAVRGANDDEA